MQEPCHQGTPNDRHPAHPSTGAALPARLPLQLGENHQNLPGRRGEWSSALPGGRCCSLPGAPVSSAPINMTRSARTNSEKIDVLPVCITGLRTQSQNASHASRGHFVVLTKKLIMCLH